MNAKIVKDNTLPSNWKRIVTKDHKYIVTQAANTRSMESEVNHSDDCTLNNMVYLFMIKGGIEKARLAIGMYEAEEKQREKDIKKLDRMVGLEVAS